MELANLLDEITCQFEERYETIVELEITDTTSADKYTIAENDLEDFINLLQDKGYSYNQSSETKFDVFPF